MRKGKQGYNRFNADNTMQPWIMLLKRLHKQKKKIPSCREMKTVMLYSVYLNVPWIAVLSCVGFNQRGDMFLFTKNPTSKNRDCSDIKSGRSCLTGTTIPSRVCKNTINCISGSACSALRAHFLCHLLLAKEHELHPWWGPIYFHLWRLNAKSDRRL